MLHWVALAPQKPREGERERLLSTFLGDDAATGCQGVGFREEARKRRECKVKVWQSKRKQQKTKRVRGNRSERGWNGEASQTSSQLLLITQILFIMIGVKWAVWICSVYCVDYNRLYKIPPSVPERLVQKHTNQTKIINRFWPLLWCSDMPWSQHAKQLATDLTVVQYKWVNVSCY